MLGSVFALSSAFFWAIAVILFKKSGDLFSPISLNIYKSMVAMVLISFAMLVTGIPFFPEVPLNHWLMLALSGFLGITLADIFFFIALNRLGASLMAIVECLYLPSVLFFSILILGEHLGTGPIMGGILILSAVFVGTKGKEKDKEQLSKDTVTGLVSGVLAVIFLSLGIVIIKDVLEQTHIFWATLVRVFSGGVALMVIVLFLPKRKQYLGELKLSRAWLTALPASVSGNFIALLCWVGGMKYTTASQAAILNQMSTIFIFILAAFFLKEKITPQKTLAICMAVTGACLTIFI